MPCMYTCTLFIAIRLHKFCRVTIDMYISVHATPHSKVAMYIKKIIYHVMTIISLDRTCILFIPVMFVYYFYGQLIIDFPLPNYNVSPFSDFQEQLGMVKDSAQLVFYLFHFNLFT